MARLLKNGTVRIAEPLADALEGWSKACEIATRELESADPYIALLDAEINKTANEGRGGNPSYDIGFFQGLIKAKQLYTNPPKAGDK